MDGLTLADIGAMISRLEGQIGQLQGELAREREFRRVLVLLVAQHGDPTHASVQTAAKIKGCSERTIHRRIKERTYTLEKIPGTREHGIPVEQLFAEWVDVGTARRALQREREAQIGKND